MYKVDLFLSRLSLISTFLFCRNEHTDRLRSGTRAKDSRGCLESLPEVRRLGQRHPDFGSSEGEKGGVVWGGLARQEVLPH